jgi:hypothetical protein
LGVYVDDLIVTGTSTRAIMHFKDQMQSMFAMSDLGLLSFYLGIEVHQSNASITLKQAAYAAKLVEKAGLADCNPVHIPMEPRLKLSKDSKNPAVDKTLYRSIVGSLRYLVHTHPDITFAVGFVSRFMEEPTTEHWAAVKHLIRYVAGTLHFGCRYERDAGELNLIGFSDADHAGDIDDRKSTTGMVFLLRGSAISWQSQKQKATATSSCEAEYMAASAAACQGIWLRRMLAELLGRDGDTITLLIDNKSAIQLSKNPVFHDRSKHIDIKYHHIRECVQDGRINVDYVRTSEQLADILTKALPRPRFQELRKKLGIVEIKTTD